MQFSHYVQDDLNVFMSRKHTERERERERERESLLTQYKIKSLEVLLCT